MENVSVQAFIGLVIANLAVLCVVVLDRVPPPPPGKKQRRDERCTCPCCRCGDSLD